MSFRRCLALCEESYKVTGTLLQYIYEGRLLYVCRNCGDVYELVPREERQYKYDLQIWQALWKQPYYWKTIRERRGIVASDLIHFSGAVKTHPIIEAHCKGDPADAADMIVRHLIGVKGIFSRSFFFEKTDEKLVSCNGEELVIADGQTDGQFPEDEFCVFREDRDHITFECNEIEVSNIYGYAADVNEEDWESVANYTTLRISFLSKNKADLPADITMLDELPAVQGNTCEIKGIIKDPFGLEGYFLYQLCGDCHEFGYWL